MVRSKLLVAVVGAAGLTFAGTFVALQSMAGAAADSDRIALSPEVSPGTCESRHRTPAETAACDRAGYFDDLGYDDLRSSADRRIWRMLHSDVPGEMSVLVEDISALDPVLIRECRDALATDAEAPIAPLYCNALVLMIDGKIPDGEHYTEAELRKLMED